MNWKTKAHAMAILSRVPLGRAVYHLGQRVVRSDRSDAREYVDRAIEVLELARAGGVDIAGATVLEIGTGWRPFVPFVLYLAGAERIISIDINPWLTKKYAVQTCETVAEFIPTIADRLNMPEDSIRQRYAAAVSNSGNLKEILRGFHVEYYCPADARAMGLPDESVSVVCSSNVLEHVPPEVLRAMHRESFRVLKPGGLAVHRFNPQDHFAFVDRSITGANFLRYSPREWHWLGGSGLSYHNRLRCVQHLAMFEAAGFETVVNRVRVDARAAGAIRNAQLPVHEDFSAYTPEELSADYMWYVGRRPLGREVEKNMSPALRRAPGSLGEWAPKEPQ